VEERARRLVEEACKPLGPKDPRRHHFIPQFFLRRFATDDGRIAVVSLDDPSKHTTPRHRGPARRSARTGAS
jgi:hypothetical protein